MREDWVYLVNMNYSGSYNAGTEVSRKGCWAQKLDANRIEFYLAMEAGKRVDAIFEVSPLDYIGQQVLIHGSETYEILRSYSAPSGTERQGNSGAAKPDTVQLTCVRRDAL